MRLARQIHITLIGVVLFAVGAFSAVILISSERLEHTLLDTLINNEAGLIASYLTINPNAELPHDQMTRAWLTSPYRQDETPELLEHMELGIGHDVKIDGKPYHVIRKTLNGGVLTVAANIEALEHHELMLEMTVTLGGIGIIVMIILISQSISRRVASPVQSLAAQLDQLSMEQKAPSLAGQYQGAEVESIAAALDRYNERIRALIDRERSFSSSASHELRSPITVLRSSLELMEMDANLPERLRPTIQRAQRNAKRMSEVLDGLMLLARDDDQSTLDAIELEPLCAELVHDMRSELPDLAITYLTSGEAGSLRANDAHLRMLLSNLLRNAAQHAPKQPVELHRKGLQISVTDQGPGVPAELLPHIFQPHQRSSDSLGAGLGLYIAAAICQRNGWSIEGKNQPGGGFRIELNLAPDQAA